MIRNFRNDGAEQRRKRIAQIAQFIQAALFQNKEAGWIPLNKNVCQIMIDTGLKRSTVMEIIQLLSDTGRFELDLKNDRINRCSV